MGGAGVYSKGGRETEFGLIRLGTVSGVSSGLKG